MFVLLYWTLVSGCTHASKITDAPDAWAVALPAERPFQCVPADVVRLGFLEKKSEKKKRENWKFFFFSVLILNRL